MGIRAQISDKPVENGERHDHDIVIVIDNGGGGGGTFQANVYFKYDSKYFSIVANKGGAEPKGSDGSGKGWDGSGKGSCGTGGGDPDPDPDTDADIEIGEMDVQET